MNYGSITDKGGVCMAGLQGGFVEKSGFGE